MSQEAFQEFRKIARLNRDCVITEKLDGTNAQIFIGGDFQTMLVGSRNRWLDVKNDNHGFYRWAMAHQDDLLKLGPGRHYGEWWGSGIQRGYGLPAGEKRFSLFNTGIWTPANVPGHVHVVPVLYQGPFRTGAVEAAVDQLRRQGSSAVPFMNPEGVVIYHIHAGQYFKVTLEHDQLPKSLVV